ncbi:MAG: glycosyltransferase [Planctomycetota bacterium]
MPEQSEPAPPHDAHGASRNGSATLRTIHGVTGAAGQPWTISRALRRIGVEADCVLMNSSKFGYGADMNIQVRGDGYDSFADFLREATPRYDVFHFYFRPYFYFDSKRLTFPSGADLLALRAAGKTLVYHFRGSEIRLHSRFREVSPYHYVDEDPNKIVTKFPEHTMKMLMTFVESVAHKVFVPDPELQTYMPSAGIVPRAIDLEDWPNVGLRNDEEPLIVHAPSRRIVKGSDHVIAAIETLKAEGLKFRFEVIEGLPNDVARQRYQEADIVVDQLRIGWYGVLAVEAMALGKAVVSYIRDDLIPTFDDGPPLAVANPDTITDVLRRLITDVEHRRAVAHRGRTYCERVHDSAVVAQTLRHEYEDAIANPRDVDINGVLDFFRHQKNVMKKQIGTRPSTDPIARFFELRRNRGLKFATGRAIRKLIHR